MNKQFQTVAVAGTFDRLHDGHQKILMQAIASGQKVFCGLTTPKLNQNKILSQTIQAYGKREETLKSFFKWQRIDEVNILPLDNPFGPTLEKTEIQAIVVSNERQTTVDSINQIRAKRHLAPLEKIIFPLVAAQDKDRLSSSRIRLGQINRQGKVFNLLFQNKDLKLPSNLRSKLKKPLGKLINDLSQVAKKPTPLTITVGDIVTQSFLKTNTPFSLAVIDRKSQRNFLRQGFHDQLFSQISNIKKTKNIAGTVSKQTILTIQYLLLKIVFDKLPWIMEVEGEEDLTVLPISLLAPLESLIFYGQPDRGIVKVRVTEKIKEKTYNLLRKFV